MSTHPPTRHARFRALASAAAVAIALTVVSAGPAAAQPTSSIRNMNAQNAITGSYIVVFKDGAVPKTDVGTVTDRLASEHRAAVGFRYSHAIRGFSAKMTSAQAKRLSIDPTVAFVEQDRRVTINAIQSPTPSWGLDRLSQRSLPLNNTFSYAATGAGVTAYVIDTGIRLTHDDFGGRAVWGTNTTGDGNDTDCNGHGTHVSGTIGGTAFGVAKTVKLVAVKVLGCTGSGSLSAVAAGVDWVTANHTSGPAVANLSLGTTGSDSAVESAIRSSISDGVVYGIASGNSNDNACTVTPARVAEAITVNATESDDARASFSNYGSCTDIFAPGQDITSDWNTSDTATETFSGTSMAAPHVVGAAAVILSATPTATPAQVASTMIANSTMGKVRNPGTDSPNRLLYTGTLEPPRYRPHFRQPAVSR